MTKFQKIFFFGFLLTVALLVYAEASKPEQVNWFPSYFNKDKIPYGTFVFTQLMEESFEDNLTQVNIPPYQLLQDSTIAGTYLFINDRVQFDTTELEELTSWVEKGNSVFISSHYHTNDLLDSLNIETNTLFLMDGFTTEPMLNLVNEKLKSDTPFHIEKDVTVTYFDKIDTLSQKVLGVTQLYNDTLSIDNPLVNFIMAPYGDGTFYFHNQPEIFTNYFLLLNENSQHTKNVLSYINDGSHLYLDAYYKSGKPINISPLHILLNNRYLKWAYYFVLIGAVLFILFQGKRKQRSIPIIKPLVNKSYEYTQTISGMYFDKKDHHGIARKQIALFFEFIRTQLRLPTENLDSRFLKTLSARSNNDIETTTSLFTFIEKISHQHATGEQELIKLNKLITEYKPNIDGKP
ncbi:MAG: DUF4350 domain-containing protein [Flavobacteriaceae bacterium]|nr:DUF4350 domain-containing protein [Flavobacteriaceae bacterium]